MTPPLGRVSLDHPLALSKVGEVNLVVEFEDCLLIKHFGLIWFPISAHSFTLQFVPNKFIDDALGDELLL